jgi:hypothetical protein
MVKSLKAKSVANVDHAAKAREAVSTHLTRNAHLIKIAHAARVVRPMVPAKVLTIKAITNLPN